MILALWGFWTVPLSFSGLEQNLSPPPRHPRLRRTCLESMVIAMSSKTLWVWNDRFVSEKTPRYSVKRKPATAFNYGVQPDGHAQTIVIVMSGTQ
jgi:hypothetical protein